MKPSLSLCTSLTALLLAAAVPANAAGVYMCTDPDTGKMTFTDKACPSKTQGTKVKVDTTNFGDGVANKRRNNATWTSHIDRSVSGRDNIGDKGDTPASINGNGLLGADN